MKNHQNAHVAFDSMFQTPGMYDSPENMRLALCSQSSGFRSDLDGIYQYPAGTNVGTQTCSNGTRDQGWTSLSLNDLRRG